MKKFFLIILAIFTGLFAVACEDFDLNGMLGDMGLGGSSGAKFSYNEEELEDNKYNITLEMKSIKSKSEFETEEEFQEYLEQTGNNVEKKLFDIDNEMKTIPNKAEILEKLEKRDLLNSTIKNLYSSKGTIHNKVKNYEEEAKKADEKCEEAIAFEAADEINDILKEKGELMKKYGITVEIITPKIF